MHPIKNGGITYRPTDYIEFFYNPQRKHVRNGMLSPIDFEQQQKLKLQGLQETRGYSTSVCGSTLQVMIRIKHQALRPQRCFPVDALGEPVIARSCFN